MKTISQYPLAIGEIVKRNAVRSDRRARLLCLLRRLTHLQSRRISSTHVARISPNETIESNLPLR